jgi:hypothetical protein
MGLRLVPFSYHFMLSFCIQYSHQAVNEPPPPHCCAIRSCSLARHRGRAVQGIGLGSLGTVIAGSRSSHRCLFICDVLCCAVEVEALHVADSRPESPAKARTG